MSLGRPVLVLSLAGAIGLTLARQVRVAEPSAGFGRIEQARIRSHFDSVLGELRARDVSGLGAEQLARRARLVDELEAYRDRGFFPRNYDSPVPVPSFVDTRTGARCAVGHLLESTGRHDVVNRVAQSNLNVYAMELGSDTAFTGWLDQHGLTLAEAARIQPSYGPIDEGRYYPRNESTLMFAASAGALGVVNALTNSTGKNRALSYVGVAAGVVSMVAGLDARDGRTAKPAVSGSAIGAGATSAAIAVFTLLPRRPQQASSSRISLSPLIDVPRAQVPRVGLSGQLRF